MAVEDAIPISDVGITILSDPQDAVIDIVFVHGLQGHPQNTWTYKSNSHVSNYQTSLPPPMSSSSSKTQTHGLLRMFSRQRHPKASVSEEADVDPIGSRGREVEARKNVYWPKDLLAADFPMARIMTFGYNTKVTEGFQAANQGNIFSHARDLLYALVAKRRKSANRDLVFIAHSLGGILVKEVLRRSEADPDPTINRIFTSTSGILFFGTPHRGSKDWASFGEGLAGVAGWLLGVDKNDQVVHALLPTGPELELCRESFTTQWVKRGNSLVVRTFQETKGVVGVRWGGLSQLIVPPDSSSLDHPNQRARTIDDNHLGMVKFQGKHDKTYEMVKEELEELVERKMQLGSLTEHGAS